jgi:HemX protein
VTHLLPLLLYLGALALWLGCLVTGSRGRGPVLASAVTALAVATHVAALVLFRVQYGELPLVGPGAALSTLALVGGIILLATLPLREVARVAIALLPFIIAVQAAALWLGVRPSPMALDFQGVGFVLHVTFAFLGYQGLAIAFAAGILYLIQHHELKEKRLGRFFHFIPPLATLDRVGRVGLWGGFGALTVALGFGWAWTVQHRGSLEMGDPKVLWAILSWLVFAGILAVRFGPGRSDYRGAVASVIGFALVIGSYLVLRLTVSGSGLFL